MSTMLMNSKNSKTSDLYRLVLNLTDKMDLRGGEKCVALSDLITYHTWRSIKKL